eukprot:Protomagalhaensia_sp_Gyna_25__3690@NODE_3313_length_628_cov_3_205433_g2587_i1_p1_GENE_NODE_3313_length_628_cov_3_205433_g2587_i1NODE_3313_length_628_cov_3_205433_g2587_i1_p1_ORF_typecomplete_len176_score34_66IF2/PF11987_8/3_6e14GTP_EFTU_D4/PF14578_6/16GTP_EFTU_D4/PF14578_6/7_7e09_NODE_3313_length_628_cov_3_205433_g2587_i13530
MWKLDVKKASTMRERGKEEYSVILAFDVKVDPDAEKEAKVLGVKIFSADIIYHLFDAFTKHMTDFREEKKKQAASDVVFPCILQIIPSYVFMKIGKVTSIELNQKTVSVGIKGQEVCIKISGDTSITYGRHFDHKQKLFSLISRHSIDTMKLYFREDLEKHVKVVITLKKVLGIV